jgi:hypothetical protein
VTMVLKEGWRNLGQFRSRQLSRVGLNVDDDGLDNLGRGVEVDEALVDAELVRVPSLGTFTTRGLSGGDLEVLGGETDRSLDGKTLAAGALDQFGADLLKRLDLSAGQGNSDAVALGSITDFLLVLLVRHCEWAVKTRQRATATVT